MVSGSTIYAGGDFTTMNGSTTRNRLAAIEAATGNVTPWDPNANNSVNVLAGLSDRLYAGGLFTTMGNSPRPAFARFDADPNAVTLTSFRAAPSFDPAAWLADLLRRLGGTR